MKVANGRQKRRDLAKIAVNIHLFEEGLSESFGILGVRFIGPLEDRATVFLDTLPFKYRALQVILTESQLVQPGRRLLLRSELDANDNIWIAARGKAAQAGNIASFPDGGLEAATD